ncbi:MAG: MarR family winged helix-turn-helix transcriptional regulator [Baekduiaceae bacterium]
MAADARHPDDLAAASLDGKLGAALERVGHALRVRLSDEARARELSPIQAQLLLRLAHEPAPRRRAGVLAAELDVTPPTVSDALAALRRKGLIDDGAVEGDRRGRLLALSSAGGQVADALASWQQPVADHLAGVAPARKADTLALLVDLMGALHDAGVINVARTCPTCRFFRRDAPAGDPHRCALLDTPLRLADLRVDCAEHEPAAS